MGLLIKLWKYFWGIIAGIISIVIYFGLIGGTLWAIWWFFHYVGMY